MRLRGRGRRAKRKGIRRCTTTSSREESAAVRLPMDIIEDEILCRLPVKPLLRCKSVCKLWYSLIKNPNPKFIKTHHQHHHQNRTTRPLFLQIYNSPQHLPIAFNPSAKTDYSIWPIPMVVDQNQNQNQIEGGKNYNNINALSFFSYYLGLPYLAIFLRPVNSVSLIVLPNLAMDRCRMAIFNPVTRQLRKIPIDDFEVNSLIYQTNVNHIFGFGICSVTPLLVYKLVWLNLSSLQTDVAPVAKVYTVVVGGGGGDQDWRTINATLPRRFVLKYLNNPAYNASVNGRCYWLSRDFVHILVFDMDEEVFPEMNSPVPSIYSDGYEVPERRLNVVFSEMRCCGKECDSLALFIFRPNFVDISVLDKEEEWHWIRYKVSYIHRPVCDLFNLNPLCLQELPQSPITEAILLKAGGNSFALYNPTTNYCVRFEDPSDDSNTYHKVYIFNFKESLFSVDGAIQVSDRVLEDFYTF